MHLQLGDIGSAKDRLKDILKIDPCHDDALMMLYSLFSNNNEHQEAFDCLKGKMEREPNGAVYCNAALSLSFLDETEKAIEYYTKGISYNPEIVQLWNNRSAAYRMLDEYEKAASDADCAIEIDPKFPGGWSNRGVIYYDLDELDKAEEYYLKALEVDPNTLDARFGLSQTLIKQNRFYEGFEQYEERFKLSKFKLPQSMEMRWTGEPLEGKTILLVDEQGLGDTLLFARYIPIIKAMGAKVFLVVERNMFYLLNQLGLDDLIEITNDEKGMKSFDIRQLKEPFDYYCFLGSMPYILKTTSKTIPSPDGYLSPSTDRVEKWEEILGPKTKPRVGIVWAGGTEFLTDHRRSMTLKQFATALPTDVEYICLQKNLRPADKEIIEDYTNIKFIGDQLEDFADTAAVMECCDLVISTCTSVINLAGALGKDSWVLLPFSPDWRWYADWYKSITQYRQVDPGNWTGVLARVKTDLKTRFNLE